MLTCFSCLQSFNRGKALTQAVPQNVFTMQISTVRHGKGQLHGSLTRRQRTPEERTRDLIGHVNLAKEEIERSDYWK